MATMKSLFAGLSSSHTPTMAGIPCQFSSRTTRKTLSTARVFPTIRAEAEEEPAAEGDDDFEARLAKLQRKVTSGTGKKAELRKAKKEWGGDAYTAAPQAGKTKSLFLEPIPLKESVSDELTVTLGMTPYTERLHGRLAALGLAAVLLVELATGTSLVNFHDSGTLTVQVYTVIGLAVLFVKYEKEKISVWPKE